MMRSTDYLIFTILAAVIIWLFALSMRGSATYQTGMSGSPTPSPYILPTPTQGTDQDSRTMLSPSPSSSPVMLVVPSASVGIASPPATIMPSPSLLR